jgi:iron complex outermembrane receptor protein
MDGGNLIANQWTNNLDLTRAFDTGLFEKPLNVSTGLEFRREGFEIQSGELASYGDGGYVFPVGSPLAGQRPNPGAPGLTGFTPADAHNYSRTNTAGYVDFSQSLTDKWDASVAGRFEHYSDFGDTASGKLSTRYAFTPQFAMRGTVSNGFRAPSLQQEYYSSSLTAWRANTLTGQLEQNVTRYVTVDDAAGQALGAKALKPEKSMNYSVGFVATPTSNLDITVDLYQIDINNRILQTSNLQGPAVSNLLASKGLDPNQIVSYWQPGRHPHPRDRPGGRLPLRLRPVRQGQVDPAQQPELADRAQSQGTRRTGRHRRDRRGPRQDRQPDQRLPEKRHLAEHRVATGRLRRQPKKPTTPASPA